jgi:hypothetical protein
MSKPREFLIWKVPDQKPRFEGYGAIAPPHCRVLPQA